MRIARKPKRELQEASKRLINAMRESGYITDRDAKDVLYRLEVGDRAAYSDVREMLLSMAAQYNGMA